MASATAASAASGARENVDLECFLVTKHSWKGKYKRIFSIGSTGVSTYNLDKFDLTNRWQYNEVVSVLPNKSGNTAYEFVLNLRKDKKVDTIKLSSEYRSEILTSLLKYYKEFSDKPKHITDDVECPTESFRLSSSLSSPALNVRLNGWIRILVSSLLLQPRVTECLPCSVATATGSELGQIGSNVSDCGAVERACLLILFSVLA
uniref:DnaJ homolog subfamily C member 13 n=1 Tax=Culex pipiens TaxID=7175 RepID=A0A8D8KNU5_CULPI